MIYVKPISFPKILQVVKLFQYIEKQILPMREIFFYREEENQKLFKLLHLIKQQVQNS